MRRAAKNPAGTRKFPKPGNASRIPMPLLPRILLLPTTPHGIIRRALETIAARVRTVAGIAETVAIADAGGEGAGDAGAAEAMIAIAVDGTAAQADEICLPRNTLRRRANAIRAALTIAALRVIAAQARRSSGRRTTSSCRVNRSPSIASVRCHRRWSRWETTSQR